MSRVAAPKAVLKFPRESDRISRRFLHHHEKHEKCIEVFFIMKLASSHVSPLFISEIMCDVAMLTARINKNLI